MANKSNEFKLVRLRDDEEHQRVSCVTLFCYLSSKISAVNMEIRWFKETDCVCLYKNRQVTEGRGYEGRVGLITQELQRGNVSLQIRDCRQPDTGVYLCQVTSGDTTEELTLVVARGLSSLASKLVSVRKFNREWSEEERMKMEESALRTGWAKTFKSNLMQKNTQPMEKDKLDHLTKDNMKKLLREKEALLENTVKEVESSKKQLETLRKELQDKSSELQEMDRKLEEKNRKLETLTQKVEEVSRALLADVHKYVGGTD